MRPKLNKVKWQAIHIDIEITETDISSVEGSRKQTMSKDEFFSSVVSYLDDNGYVPRYSIEVMKKKLKSPYSNSEYYTFLKIEDEKRIKVVLDIRMTDHFHTKSNWGKHSERERHIYHTKNFEVPDIEVEFEADGSNAQIEFTDVSEHSSSTFCLVGIDGILYTGYDDALKAMKKKIDQLP